MGKLTDYLEEHTDLDSLQTLSFRSGVDYQLLDAFDQDSIILDDHHVGAIALTLGCDRSEILSLGQLAYRPQSEVSRKGAPPEGYTLIAIRGEDLQEGDYISYIPPTSEAGSHWVLIDKIERRKLRSHFYTDMYSDDVRLASVTSSYMIRIARRAA